MPDPINGTSYLEVLSVAYIVYTLVLLVRKADKSIRLGNVAHPSRSPHFINYNLLLKDEPIAILMNNDSDLPLFYSVLGIYVIPCTSAFLFLFSYTYFAF